MKRRTNIDLHVWRERGIYRLQRQRDEPVWEIDRLITEDS
jgi:hypothetical protein